MLAASRRVKPRVNGRASPLINGLLCHSEWAELSQVDALRRGSPRHPFLYNIGSSLHNES